ncbi:MAG: VanZ family protein [Microbacterium sp.]
MTDSTRGLRYLAAVCALAVALLLTLGPRALVAPARWAFLEATDALTAPLLARLPFADTDQVLNALLFVPLGATVALLLHRRAWPFAIIAALVLSVTVEYAQASIPGRVPDGDDVLWNTVGGAIGVLVVTAPRLLRPRSAQRGSVTRT